jgi:hypothetical protein
VQRSRQARACAGQSGGCTHGGARARRNVARACGGGGEHASCGAWPSSTTARPPTKKIQKARGRPRCGRKWTARPRQTRAPMCSSRRAQCRARARPCRAASALAAPTCSGLAALAQNRDEKGGAAPRPSTRTMVLCTGTRESRVRCAPRQRRPGRAPAARAARALFPILSPFSARFSERQTRANFPPKKYLTT